MSSRSDRIRKREKLVRRQEGASHGRDPENLDPEMLEGEEAEIVRANREIARGEDDRDAGGPALRPGERLPPD